MRKALSFVLVLALIMGSFSFAFAANTDNQKYSDIAGKKCEGAVTVLSALGVVDGYADGTYKPEKVVTRAEMAKLLIVALGMDEYVKGTYTSFSDVGNHWANSYIAYAASMGIIEGYPDGTFRPDNTVTYQEAVTMIVRALGYQDQYLTGTWPASHVSKAKGLGLLDGIVATADGANRGDVAILLYNALSQDVISYDSNGTVIAGDNMLERLNAEEGKRTILHADLDFADGIDLSKFYGYSVIPYTIENDDDEDVIVAVGDIKGTAYEVELTNDGFTYNDKDYAVGQMEALIVNNHLVSENQEPIFGTGEDDSLATIIVNGSLSKTGTDLYSVVQWQVSGALLVTDDDVTDIADAIEDADDVADFLGTDLKLVYDDDDEAFDVTVAGAAKALKDIAEDDVLYIYADGDSNIEKIAVARNKVEGEIDKVKNGDFTLDGKVYALSIYAIDDNLDGLDADSVGDEYTLFLGPDGKIFAAEVVDAKGDYVLVIAKDDKDDFQQSVHKIKVMDNKGAVTTLTLKGQATAEDVTYTNLRGIEALASGDIITYATNKDGKVTEIKKFDLTPYNGTMSKRGVYNGDVASADTIVFTFDGELGNWSTAEDDYAIGSFAKIAGEEFTSYYYEDKGDIEVMIVGDKVGGSNDSFGMIVGVANAKNKDGDKIFDYDALIGGKATTVSTDDRNKESEGSTVRGDFFIFEIDGEGVVTGVTKVNENMTVEEDGIAALAGTNFVPVTDIDKAAGWIQLDNIKYSIGDKPVVYKMTFDKNDFDSYVVGSFSNVANGAYVIGFDTVDDDEDMIDTFVVITRADWNKYFQD